MRFSISTANPTPLYRQLIDQIKLQILAGELQPGQSLPSIRQLAGDLAASVITVKRAYADLEAQGLILTRPGLGTFVADITGAKRRRLREEQVVALLHSAVRAADGSGMSRVELESLFKSILEREE